ncbi:MAG: DegV family protein [Clostridia bacterium]|nr:DegV family protein [Clostridia bacterium]
MFQLFIDTDTDFTPEIAKEYGYKLISMPYSLNDKDVYPYVDFKQYDYASYYNELRNGVIPKTFALSPQKYIEHFEPVLKEGKDILYVHFSSAMSGTFNAMNLAWKELKQKYPERQLCTVDTKGVSICSYNIAIEVAKMAKRGDSMQDILAWAEKEVDKFAVYFYADDLKFFARSGRVSGLSAVMGGILGIRPIININTNGVMNSISKAKGRRGALRAVMQYVSDLQDDIKNYYVVIGHADAYELAVELENKLKESYGKDLKTIITVVNPTIGAHCGPDTVGVCFHAKHR